MKGSFRTAVIFVLVLASTAFGQGQYELLTFDFCGGGARAEGMGKAYLGVSNDVTGGGWNPAGLYNIDKPVIAVSWASYQPRGFGNRITFNSGLWSAEHTGSFSNIGSLNFAAPLRIKGHPFVGSFNYTRNFDVYQLDAGAYTGYVTFAQFINGVLTEQDVYMEQEWESRLDGGINSVNVGFGTRLYEKISIGLTINVYTGKLLREFTAYNIYPEFPIGDGMQEGFGEEYVTIMDTNKISGINFTGGVKYSGEKLGLGMVVRTPFKLVMDNDTIISQEGFLNGVPVDAATMTRYDMDNKTKYDMPWIVGVGAAYNVKENFMVAADVEIRAFKGGKVYQVDSLTINPSGDNIETISEYDPFWENAWAFRMGGEYVLQTGVGQVPVRAGLGMFQNPDPDYDELGGTSQATCYSFSLGSGLHWEQIHLDASYSYSTMDRSWFRMIDYSSKDHRLNFTFTGVF